MAFGRDKDAVIVAVLSRNSVGPFERVCCICTYVTVGRIYLLAAPDIGICPPPELSAPKMTSAGLLVGRKRFVSLLGHLTLRWRGSSIDSPSQRCTHSHVQTHAAMYVCSSSTYEHLPIKHHAHTFARTRMHRFIVCVLHYTKKRKSKYVRTPRHETPLAGGVEEKRCGVFPR